MNWGSASLQAYIIKAILEEGYGLQAELMIGSTFSSYYAMLNDDELDVIPELWYSMLPDPMTDDSNVVLVGDGLAGAGEGFYISKDFAQTYGISSIEDMLRPEVAAIFSQGGNPPSLMIGPEGWGANAECEILFYSMGLDAQYQLIAADNGSAFNSNITSKLANGDPIFTYYWGPNAEIADLVKVTENLDPSKYSGWDAAVSAADGADYVLNTEELRSQNFEGFKEHLVSTAVSRTLLDGVHSEAVTFLTNFDMDSATLSGLAKYMDANDLNSAQAAAHYLETNNEWEAWVTSDAANAVTSGLANIENSQTAATETYRPMQLESTPEAWQWQQESDQVGLYSWTTSVRRNYSATAEDGMELHYQFIYELYTHADNQTDPENGPRDIIIHGETSRTASSLDDPNSSTSQDYFMITADNIEVTDAATIDHTWATFSAIQNNSWSESAIIKDHSFINWWAISHERAIELLDDNNILHRVTEYGVETLSQFGQRNGDNMLNGTQDADVIDGTGANDFIKADAGNDKILSGLGNDSISVGQGADHALGGEGDDTLILSVDGTWGAECYAYNVSSANNVGTGERINLSDYNRFSDVIDGGSGLDKIILSDSSDALFLDDVYTPVHHGVDSGTKARLLSVDHIYAGRGNDLIDLSSDELESGNDVTM